MPVPHEKRVRKPILPPAGSFFDIWLDFQDVIPEMNENNNRCTIPYLPPTATAPTTWGRVKSLYE
jgi:hypothetical protein